MRAIMSTGTMSSTIIDREDAIRALSRLSVSGQRRMALIYGRRRVGKTYLLTNLWPRERAFYFTASDTSPEQNRQVLVHEAARWSGEELRPEDHPTWRAVFRSILGLAPDRDIVIVLDEFQYLARGDDGLAEVVSELNAVWEGQIHRSGGLLLVLSGSAIRTLEALRTGGSPLYGRLDWSDQVRPFDYYHAGRMVEAYDPIDRVRAYAAFGGVPKYLAAIDTSRTLEENIIELILSPAGAVRLQLENVLGQEEGLRDVTKYQAILGAVGVKRREAGGIAASLGQELDRPLRRMVGKLVELGFLDEDLNFEEPRNQGVRYRIGDPALRMYYGLVLPNESAIEAATASRVWQDRLRQEAFPTYVGLHVFEDVVRQGYLRHFDRAGIPAVESWGRWAGKDRDRRDLEIDVVARLLDGRMLTGAAKMRRRPADPSVLLGHRRDLERLADSGRAWAREALHPTSPILVVSGSGFTDTFDQVADALDQPVIRWTLDDLFRADRADG
jgi:hypothetical protein